MKGLQRYAVLTAAMTLVLILAGGFVTTTRTGDTISGWPFMWGKLSAGFPIEWTHRILAASVAAMVAGLMFWVGVREDRPWVKRLAMIAFAAVMAQALLGGLRVFIPKDGSTPQISAAIAIVHACFGQILFGLVTAIAFFVSPTWKNLKADDAVGAARKLAVVTTVFAFLQLVAGAVTRHTGAGIIVHLVGAGLVVLHASLLASRLMLTPVRRGATILMLLVGIQVALGLGSWAITAAKAVPSPASPGGSLVVVTTHVAVGALVLATCIALTLACFRSHKPEPALEVEAA